MPDSNPGLLPQKSSGLLNEPPHLLNEPPHLLNERPHLLKEPPHLLVKIWVLGFLNVQYTKLDI